MLDQRKRKGEIREMDCGKEQMITELSCMLE